MLKKGVRLKRRLTGFLLSAVMFISSVPTTALADSEERDITVRFDTETQAGGETDSGSLRLQAGLDQSKIATASVYVALKKDEAEALDKGSLADGISLIEPENGGADTDNDTAQEEQGRVIEIELENGEKITVPIVPAENRYKVNKDEEEEDGSDDDILKEESDSDDTESDDDTDKESADSSNDTVVGDDAFNGTESASESITDPQDEAEDDTADITGTDSTEAGDEADKDNAGNEDGTENAGSVSSDGADNDNTQSSDNSAESDNTQNSDNSVNPDNSQNGDNSASPDNTQNNNVNSDNTQSGTEGGNSDNTQDAGGSSDTANTDDKNLEGGANSLQNVSGITNGILTAEPELTDKIDEQAESEEPEKKAKTRKSRVKDDGYYIHFELDADSHIDTEIKFVLPEGKDSLVIDIAKKDIIIEDVYNIAGEAVGSYTKTLKGTRLRLGAMEDESIELGRDQDFLELMEGASTLSDLHYYLTLTNDFSGGKVYELSLTLPKGVSFTDPELTVSGAYNDTLMSGDNFAAQFKINAEDSGDIETELIDPEITDQTLSFKLVCQTAGSGKTGETGETGDAGESGETGSDEDAIPEMDNLNGTLTFYSSLFSLDYNQLFGADNSDHAIELIIKSDSGNEYRTCVELKPELSDMNFTQGALSAVAQTVTWNDNNNEAGKRPEYGTGEGKVYPKISYTITSEDGQQVSGVLNDTTLTKLGFTDENGNPKWPEIEGTTTGFNVMLPKELYGPDDAYGNHDTYTIKWAFEAPEVGGYSLEGPEGTTDEAWKYTVLTDFTFTLNLRRGGSDKNLDRDAVLKLLRNFRIGAQPNRTGETSAELPPIDFSSFSDIDIQNGPDDSYIITVNGLKAYDTDGAPIVYWVEERIPEDLPEGEEGKITVDELGSYGTELLPEGNKGDYYAISYDNTGVDNAGTNVPEAYDGGKINLTLTGVTEYESYKLWLDDDKDQRPNAEFVLWRYLEGGSYTSAAQLRKSDVMESGSGFVSVNANDLDYQIVDITTLLPSGTEDASGSDTENGETAGQGDQAATGDAGSDTGSDGSVSDGLPETAEKLTIEFKDDTENVLQLPKYNQDGSRFIYSVREQLTYTGSSSYEQLFGTFNADGTFTESKLPDGADKADDDTRKDGDDFVYNGGVIINRVTDNTTAKVTKTWEAAAYQAEFEDVAVEFTLYERVVDDESGSQTSGEGEEGWAESKDSDGNSVTYVLHNFTAESLSDTGSVSGLPQYDQKGHRIEYKWVETAVYQEINVAADASQEDVKAALSADKKCEVGNEGGKPTFTLMQSSVVNTTDHKVHYTSETKVEGNTTIVTNKVDDTVDFALKKVWKNADGEIIEPQGEVVIGIYQTPVGTDFDFAKPYVKVTIDKDGKISGDPVSSNGEEDEDKRIDISTDEAYKNTFNTYNSLSESWDAIIQNLPKYDETGHLYSYIAIEDGNSQGYGASYVKGYYDKTGDYSTVITNQPGKATYIMVQKNWIDDGDLKHREPVELGLYYNRGDDKLTPVFDKDGNPVTGKLDGMDGSWTSVIGFTLPKKDNGEKVGIEDIYIVEHKVGESVVNYGGTAGSEDNIPDVKEWEDGAYAVNNSNVMSSHIFDVTTDNHRYQVSYEKKTHSPDAPNSAVPNGIEALYTVTNRRLGEIDVTVEKNWVSGYDEPGRNDGIVKLTEELSEINKEENNIGKLALAIQLDFVNGTDQDGKPKTDWEITNNGSGDTVRVGGETLNIYDNAGNKAPSVQIILGPDNNYQLNNHFEFYGLPKYDKDGAVVQYQVKETWVRKEAGTNVWVPVQLSDPVFSGTLLSDIRNLWSEYTVSMSQTYEVGSDNDNVREDQNTRDKDKQEISVTNRRQKVKDVTWYKEWRDGFADDNGLRPDIYLDIYSVTHDKDGNEQIQRVKENYHWNIYDPAKAVEEETVMSVAATPQTLEAAGLDADVLEADSRIKAPETVNNTLKVTKSADKSNEVWEVTIQGLPKYDSYGHEIFYFAVERTEVKVSEYDYQAVKYAAGATGVDDADENYIGNRDGEDITNKELFAANTLNLKAEDISWVNENEKPDNIGRYNNTTEPGNTYPQYALKEDGTFVNTLKNVISITGNKLWEQLPSGYLAKEDAELPEVTFTLYGYDHVPDADEMNDPAANGEKVAGLTISSDDWKNMARSGNSFSFRLDYEGENIVSFDKASGTISFVPADEDGKPLRPNDDGSYDRDRIPLYDANGNRYKYRVWETVKFDTEITDSVLSTGDVYDIEMDRSGNFTLKNTYAPKKGGLKFKKYLALPADTTVNNGGFPEVKFKLKRSYQYLNDNGEKVLSSPEDVSVTASAVTWNSSDVKSAFEKAMQDGNITSESGKTVLIYKTFVVEDLPVYAPNGSKYIYTVEENTASLGGYLTYASIGDIELKKNVDGSVDKTGFEDKFIDNIGKPQDGTVYSAGGDQAKGLYPQIIDASAAGSSGETAGEISGDVSEQDIAAAEIINENATATFYNERKDDQETVTLTGTKTWHDFGNAMGTRPDIAAIKDETISNMADDPLKLTVTRTAAGGTETLELGTDYTITYNAGTGADSNKWTFVIKGAKTGELEKYATAGVAWTYNVNETLDDNNALKGYTGSGRWSAKADGTKDGNGHVSLNGGGSGVSNSIYTSVPFAKLWEDRNGNPITSDYIDFPVKATFKLQVKIDDGKGYTDSGWTDAKEFFTDKLKDHGNTTDAVEKIGNTFSASGEKDGNTWAVDHENFALSITGKVNGGGWSGSFTNLPKFINVNGNQTKLSYRIVEDKVSYGGTNSDETAQAFRDPADGKYGFAAGSGNGLVTEAEYASNGNVTTNIISAITIKVEKAWADGDNQYSTRPNSRADSMTWESWFVLQRKTAGDSKWENVKLINLYGGNTSTGVNASEDEKWSETIEGLPALDFDEGAAEYTYRVRELKPKLEDGKVVGYTEADLTAAGFEDQLVAPGGIYAEEGSFDYTAEYSTADGKVVFDKDNEVTVTNRLIVTGDASDNVSVRVNKVWHHSDESVAKPEVNFQLKYRLTGSEIWQPLEVNSDVTLPVNEEWTYRWDGLPTSKAGADGKSAPVYYRVVELDQPAGYIELPAKVETSFEGNAGGNTAVYTFTIANVQETSFSVEKTWNGGTVPDGAEVSAGLYRTTDKEAVGSAEGEAVRLSETDASSAVRTVVLKQDNSWTGTFTGLPKYDADGSLYYYYALELDGNAPAADQGSIAYGENEYHVSYDNTAENVKTLIRNTPSTSVTGTKTWIDNGNEYGTRPGEDNFSLELYRKKEGEDWIRLDIEKEGISFKWTAAGNSDVWTYEFDNLAVNDTDGKSFTYKVTETEPELYKEADGGKGGEIKGTKGPDFVNRLEDQVIVNGIKTWEGGRGNTPVLTLSRSVDGTDWSDVEAEITWSDTGSDKWAYHFKALPKYDDKGVRYIYRVTEAKQDGFDIYYTDGNVGNTEVQNRNITNTAKGDLSISKKVTGGSANHSTYFDFTVVFTLPEDFDKENTLPEVSWMKNNGESGRMTFEALSMAADFELKSGETITFTDIPGGSAYVVTETDDKGYRQSSTGAEGNIPAGGKAESVFTNYRGGSTGGGGNGGSGGTGRPGITVYIPDARTPGSNITPVPEPANMDQPEIINETGPLPQTGQLWWPVILLGSLGEILLIAGAVFDKKNRGKNVKK